MINAEKLLGGLLRQAISGGGRRRGRRRRRKSGLGNLLGGGLGGAAGLGLLGVAIAAFEHFSKQGGQTHQPAAPPPGSMPPPPPRPAAPPPPPPGAAATPPPPPPAATTTSADAHQTATLLIQAMIAAANADSHIDPVEEREILEKLGEAGMSLEEREFILRQMADPPTLDSLLPEIDSPELARQVYAVSLLAIDIDTPAEERYIETLRARLNIDAATAAQLRDQFGAAEE